MCLLQQKRIWANQHLRRNVRWAPHYHNSFTGSMLYFCVASVRRKQHGGPLFACYFCFAVLPGSENIQLSEMMLSSCCAPPRAYGVRTYPDARAHTPKTGRHDTFPRQTSRRAHQIESRHLTGNSRMQSSADGCAPTRDSGSRSQSRRRTSVLQLNAIGEKKVMRPGSLFNYPPINVISCSL